MKLHVFRLKPAQDLKIEIEKLVANKTIKAGFVAACVGSLRIANIRMPGATPSVQDVREFRGPFEIVSLTGTLSVNGCHLHLSIADKDGKVFGGHLKEGCKVGTTVELVVAEHPKKVYKRKLDPETGFPELTI